MSASDKKKIRKEQNAAAVTERQKAEQKKQKKQTVSTIVFIVAMVLVLAVVLTSVLTAPIKRMIINNTTAATVGEHKLSATELNYFYVDAISNLYNQFSDYSSTGYQDLYVQMYTGWTPSKAVSQQVYNTETGETWADYFISSAVDTAEWTYAMYDAAMEAGFTLSETDQSAIDNNASYMSLYATLYGYSSADAYIRAIYGTSASMNSYTDYYTVCYIASAYANENYSAFEYTDSDYREYEEGKLEEFNSYSWLSYYVSADKYLTGGEKTTDENGKETITYSDEEKQNAIDAAKADADALVAGAPANKDALNLAISGLSVNKGSTTAASATEYTAQLYTNVSYYTPNEDAVKWVTSADRAAGDITAIEYSVKDSEGKETVKGYYVLYFVDSTDNTMNIGTIRHLLVAFEKGSDGKVTDEAKKTAYAEAEKLLNEFKSGEMTEEAFTTLLKANTDDVDSSGNANNGGLYSNITPDSGYVAEFTAWATADHEVGDVEIIETTYGYHIMYYVSCAELNYRDTMIDSAIRSEDYTEWEETITKDTTSETLNTKYVNKDFVMSTTNSSSSSSGTTTK